MATFLRKPKDQLIIYPSDNQIYETLEPGKNCRTNLEAVHGRSGGADADA